MGLETGILGLIVLILDVWAIVNVFGSAETTGTKVVWVLVILVLPVIGLLLWFFLGPRAQPRSR